MIAGGEYMIRIAVVDDEEIILGALCEKISEIFNHYKAEYEMFSFLRGKDLIRSCSEKNYDLIFLDIDMPDITGIDIAKKIRQRNIPTEIIFVTNKDEMVYESLKYVPFRFIRKSRFDTEIAEAVEFFFRKKDNRTTSIMVSTDDGKKPIMILDIIYVEVKGHKLTFNINNSKPLEANGTLREIEGNITKDGFIRVHQSYLVNYRYIDKVKQKGVVLDNGSIIPLGRGKYDSVKLELMRFSREM